MTSDIQNEQIDKCVLSSGGNRREYIACLSHMGDVWEFVEHPPNYGHSNDPRKCYTCCKKEHCGCNDTGREDPNAPMPGMIHEESKPRPKSVPKNASAASTTTK